MLVGAMPAICGAYGTRMQLELLAMLSSGAEDAHCRWQWGLSPVPVNAAVTAVTNSLIPTAPSAFVSIRRHLKVLGKHALGLGAC